MLLLTGATGTVGLALLGALTAAGTPVRCLVRDPRRLGPERVRVQIALGRPARTTCRSATRCAASTRSCTWPRSSATSPPGRSRSWPAWPPGAWCGPPSAPACERFVFFSALGASTRSRSRLMRAKAVAERALIESSTGAHSVCARRSVYAPERPVPDACSSACRWLPVMPIPGSGRATFQPMWAEDVADCVIAALPGGPMASQADGARYELAGPETLSYRDIVEIALRSFHRRRPIVPVPLRIVRRMLEARRAADWADRVRHLGRGRAPGDPDDLSPRHGRRRTTGRAAQDDEGDPRNRLTVSAQPCPRPGGASAHGKACSSWPDSASSPPSPAGRPMSWTAERQPVHGLIERQRDRREARDVEDRRVRREGARAPEVVPRVGSAAVDLADGDRAERQHRREERVVGGEELNQPARERLEPCPARPGS